MSDRESASSDSSESKDPADRLVAAYERMFRQTHDLLDKTRAEAAPRLREILDRTRDNMVELGELTREEAQKVSDYLRRDIEDAARYLADSGEDLRDWWRFDLQLMERRMFDMFALMADQTRLQLAQWAETARQFSLYQAGEITGPGTLVCDRCGAATHFVRAGRIPPCADCGHTAFRRREDAVDEGRDGGGASG